MVQHEIVVLPQDTFGIIFFLPGKDGFHRRLCGVSAISVGGNPESSTRRARL